MQANPEFFSKLILTALLAAGLGACSVKGSGGGGDAGGAGPADKPFANDVAGPNLDGHWISGCEAERLSAAGYRTLDIKITGQAIHRVENHFHDGQCTHPSNPAETMDGLLRFVKNVKNDIFQVEYRFKMPNYFFLFSEQIRLQEGTQLWLSDRIADASPFIPLNKSSN